ncbi:hypothetical protein [Prosthecobacter vanneervenii]|uniref:Uncharacterized protein n=1 Tax=Prosthecobacter vanneervenii TaxID=48466 RepID=A0A7W7YCF2_9BACT|nr:hypothetical protein [Prosthecobacter vanneervenii]MBB5033646.1 hypothetical protein [Prosthecobacter vanneervenii]
MKPLLVIALAIAVGYVSYEYVYPPFADAMKFTKHVPKPAPKKEVAVAPAPKPVKKAEPKVVMEEPKPEPKPEMKPEEPKPEMPKAPEPVADPNAFVPPVYPPADQLTQNWTVIPKNFFKEPKQVTIKKDLKLEMQMGKATAATNFKAGSKIFVMDQQGPNLVVGASAGSPMRGLVAMEDTDFKDVFTAAYEQVKVIAIENARKAHEYRLAAAERAKNAPAPAAGGGGSSNSKPAKDADGSYPMLLASMKAGEVTEIKPDNVKSWGEVAQEKIDGTDYWTVNVKYETQTMFGKFETEAQARIRNGKVEKWVYTGSGEVVP